MNHRFFHLPRHPGRPVRRLLRRLVFWGAAVTVALAAIVFAQTSAAGNRFFVGIVQARPWLAFVVTPGVFAGVVWLTRRVFPGAEGSGIPQTIAALKIPELAGRRSVLSLRIALGKILLTSLALCGGASAGREGPTVQIGAAIMHSLGRFIRLPSRDMERALILAGGAAGISAAFNTPLAGIVFAIEELSRSFEERTSGTVLTAVIVAGFTSMAILGNYTYFGRTGVVLSLSEAWRPALACGLGGGLCGGLFARLLIALPGGLPGRLGALARNRPVWFAALCGLCLASLGLLSDATVYGAGYEQARGLLEGGSLPGTFWLMKLCATVVSYVSGIPGGIFAPSLAVGAGLGASLSPLIPQAPVEALVILGMAGYFAAVVQAPLTAVIIVVEMTSDQSFTIPLMTVAFIAFAVSRLVCPQPLYSALAKAFLDRSVRRLPRPEPKTQ
ncbi:MAG: chloride channel protein [Desulfovibrionaceae bacterium]|nr:chloride channel protein [Desulfovibrionaceae bacterium]MBF0513259.1 chloride channel protein [Desulfovibrionaceae bacterium]